MSVSKSAPSPPGLYLDWILVFVLHVGLVSVGDIMPDNDKNILLQNTQGRHTVSGRTPFVIWSLPLSLYDPSFYNVSADEPQFHSVT